MRTETKVIQVANSPSEINAVNASQALWGWSVLSVQITDRKTVYDGDTTGYVDELGLHATTQRITESANYATITYSRDMDAPNTAELRRLEKEYENQTALAAMYLCEKTDEEWLAEWPEEQKWNREYKRKTENKGKHLMHTFSIIPAALILLVFRSELMGEMTNADSGGMMTVMMIATVLFGAVYSFWNFTRYREISRHINDPQTRARLERIKQLIEEAKAEQNAKYNEAMSLRASLVKQAQALMGA